MVGLDIIVHLSSESQGRRLRTAEESGEDSLIDKDAASSSAASCHVSKRAQEFRRLQRLLCEHLAAFLGQQTSGLHTLRKLNAVDSKNLFNISSSSDDSRNPLPKNAASSTECKSNSMLVASSFWPKPVSRGSPERVYSAIWMHARS